MFYTFIFVIFLINDASIAFQSKNSGKIPRSLKQEAGNSSAEWFGVQYGSNESIMKLPSHDFISLVGNYFDLTMPSGCTIGSDCVRSNEVIVFDKTLNRLFMYTPGDNKVKLILGSGKDDSNTSMGSKTPDANGFYTINSHSNASPELSIVGFTNVAMMKTYVNTTANPSGSGFQIFKNSTYRYIFILDNVSFTQSKIKIIKYRMATSSSDSANNSNNQDTVFYYKEITIDTTADLGGTTSVAGSFTGFCVGPQSTSNLDLFLLNNTRVTMLNLTADTNQTYFSKNTVAIYSGTGTAGTLTDGTLYSPSTSTNMFTKLTDCITPRFWGRVDSSTSAADSAAKAATFFMDNGRVLIALSSDNTWSAPSDYIDVGRRRFFNFVGDKTNLGNTDTANKTCYSYTQGSGATIAGVSTACSTTGTLFLAKDAASTSKINGGVYLSEGIEIKGSANPWYINKNIYISEQVNGTNSKIRKVSITLTSTSVNPIGSVSTYNASSIYGQGSFRNNSLQITNSPPEIGTLIGTSGAVNSSGFLNSGTSSKFNYLMQMTGDPIQDKMYINDASSLRKYQSGSMSSVFGKSVSDVIDESDIFKNLSFSSLSRFGEVGNLSSTNNGNIYFLSGSGILYRKKFNSSTVESFNTGISGGSIKELKLVSDGTNLYIFYNESVTGSSIRISNKKITENSSDFSLSTLGSLNQLYLNSNGFMSPNNNTICGKTFTSNIFTSTTLNGVFYAPHSTSGAKFWVSFSTSNYSNFFFAGFTSDNFSSCPISAISDGSTASQKGYVYGSKLILNQFTSPTGTNSWAKVYTLTSNSMTKNADVSFSQNSPNTMADTAIDGVAKYCNVIDVSYDNNNYAYIIDRCLSAGISKNSAVYLRRIDLSKSNIGGSGNIIFYVDTLIGDKTNLQSIKNSSGKVSAPIYNSTLSINALGITYVKNRLYIRTPQQFYSFGPLQ